MSEITELKKPLRRRVGKLVVELTTDGLRFRGFGRRKWHTVTFEQIAALDDCLKEQTTITQAADMAVGARRLKELHADPHTQRSA